MPGTVNRPEENHRCPPLEPPGFQSGLSQRRPGCPKALSRKPCRTSGPERSINRGCAPREKGCPERSDLRTAGGFAGQAGKLLILARDRGSHHAIHEKTYVYCQMLIELIPPTVFAASEGLPLTGSPDFLKLPRRLSSRFREMDFHADKFQGGGDMLAVSLGERLSHHSNVQQYPEITFFWRESGSLGNKFQRLP